MKRPAPPESGTDPAARQPQTAEVVALLMTNALTHGRHEPTTMTIAAGRLESGQGCTEGSGFVSC